MHVDLSDKIDANNISKAIRDGINRIDKPIDTCIAIAFNWQGDPEYSRLKAMANGIYSAVTTNGNRNEPLLLMIDGDIANIMGNMLIRENHFPAKLLSVDGVQLQELDYVDVGELIDPPGVVPVVIKSLLFS